MKITTPTSERPNATIEQMRDALRSLGPSEDGKFVVVERDDGIALQIAPPVLERCERGRVYRAATMPLAIMERSTRGATDGITASSGRT